MSDISFTDGDGHAHGTMQTFELDRIVRYAKKWAEISNCIEEGTGAAIDILEHSIKKCNEVD